MKNRFTIFMISISLVGVVFTTSCKKDDKTDIKPETNNVEAILKSLIDSTYDNYIAEYPGYIGGYAVQVLSKEGDGFYQRGMGDGLTNGVHFRGQSITKTFTAAGIVLLAERGLLNLKARIIDTIPGISMPYIPATPEFDIPYKDEITIYQLLSHRAGVFDIPNDLINGVEYIDAVLDTAPDHHFTLEEMVAQISANQLSYFPPGTAWHYSNTGYFMLSRIIERVSGRSYRQFLADEFVIPLGLTGTVFIDQPTEITLPDPHVENWYWSEDLAFNTTEQNMTAYIGEGNMITTPLDLSRFMRLLIRGEAGISPMYVNNFMLDCRPESEIGAKRYGLGVEQLINLGYGHGGDGMGTSVRTFSDPEKDFTITLFINVSNYKDGIENESYLAEQQLEVYNLLYLIKEAVNK